MDTRWNETSQITLRKWVCGQCKGKYKTEEQIVGMVKRHTKPEKPLAVPTTTPKPKPKKVYNNPPSPTRPKHKGMSDFDYSFGDEYGGRENFSDLGIDIYRDDYE